MNPVRGQNRKITNVMLNKMMVCKRLLSIIVRKSKIPTSNGMNRLNNIPSLVVVLLAAFVLSLGFFHAGWSRTPLVHASSAQNISGFAWSFNIGWISFNCSDNNSCATSDYGVTVDNSGNFSGYAWSDHVGWISFSQTSGCPEAGCVTQPKLSNAGAVTGWARACAGTVNGNCTGASRTDGWDGWIKLSGTTPDGNPYGPTFSGTTFTGYSWGSDVVGWLSWSGSGYGVATVACTASLTVNPDTVEQGQNVALTWSVSGGSFCATSCDGSGFATGGATSGSNVPATVPPSPPTTSYALTCTGGYTSTPPVNATVTVITPAAEIKANGQSVSARVNQATANNTTITWSSTNSSSCAVTKNGVAWRSGLSSAGVIETVTAQTVYAIDCQNSHNTHAVGSVTVNILPGFNEF